MELERRQFIFQAMPHGPACSEIQNESNEQFGLDALKRTAVCKWMVFGRPVQTRADDAGRPGRPRDEGIDF
jgi:hypothetical protein